MGRNMCIVAAVATTVGLVAACGNSSDTNNTTTSGTSATTTSSAASSTSSAATSSAAATPNTGSADLQSLLPTPAGTQRTDASDPIHDDGIHTHFLVNGSPTDVMGAYKTALEGKGWAVTVVSKGGGYGGGGGTLTGTNGNAYGVFTGGGYGATTDVDACAWPSQPANTDCGHS